MSALLFATRRTMRAPVNPLDKSTVVSIYPKDIDEDKITLNPGKFHIPKGSYDNPTVVVIGPSSWWKELEGNEPLLEIPVSSILIAESIVQDYCNNVLGATAAFATPGLFSVPGNFTSEQIKKDQRVLLDKAKLQQTNYFKELVRIADISWARTNGNPLAIDDNIRMAALELGLKDKPWLQDFQTMELKNCPACGVLRNSSFPICANCKTILNHDQYKALNLKTA